MRAKTVIAVAAAFGLGGLVGALAWMPGNPAADAGVATKTPRPVWSEVQWLFAIDEWGKGKAFQCKAADCGTEVNLYIRAKIGFCNCATGVADDAELERLSDFALIGKELTALDAGQPIAVAWMQGRSRPYAMSNAGRTPKSALSVAFNDRCDAIVATAVVARDRPATIEPAVIAFLNGSTVLRWAEVTLGL